MIYIFYGKDAYRRSKKVSEFIGAVRGKYPDVSVDRFWLDQEGEVERLYDFLMPRSLFIKSRRVALVFGSAIIAQDAILEKIISHAWEDKEAVLAFNEGWGDKDVPAFAKSLSKKSDVVTYSFEPLSGRAFVDYCAKECASRNLVITRDGLEFLVSVMGEDSGAVINEAERVALLKKPITRELLASMHEYWQNRGVFEFSRSALGQAPLGQRITLFEELLFQRTDPFMMFAYLAKAASTLPQIRALSESDALVKRGLLEPEQALTLFVLR